jgi:hypothetical protein
MKLQDQFCTPEQARTLKELGIAQDNQFFFLGDKGPWLGSAKVPDDSGEHLTKILSQRVSAFSCAELGQMLPQSIVRNEQSFCLTQYAQYWKEKPTLNIAYHHPILGETERQVGGSTEADARAAMLISLLTAKTVSAETVNALLKGNPWR